MIRTVVARFTGRPWAMDASVGTYIPTCTRSRRRARRSVGPQRLRHDPHWLGGFRHLLVVLRGVDFTGPRRGPAEEGTVLSHCAGADAEDGRDGLLLVVDVGGKGGPRRQFVPRGPRRGAMGRLLADVEACGLWVWSLVTGRSR